MFGIWDFKTSSKLDHLAFVKQAHSLVDPMV